MKEFLHRLAAVGNSAALVLLVLFLANARLLLDERPAPAGRQPPAVDVAPASRVVLVVIDGLRDDTAADPRAMPCLTDLARRGGRTTAAVESVVPSTVAGLTTLATGRVPPPVSFLEDFRSRPSRDGGVFAAVADRGGRSFVAGPPLWTDRYGAWIAGAYAAPAVAEDDEGVLRAGLAALDRAEDRLVVIHFVRPDEAAHLHGGRSPQYAAAARWCDEAVRRLAARLGPGGCLIVTSDHGVTDGGGHAGREPEVVATPVVVFGPAARRVNLPPLRQRDVPLLVATPLGLPWSPAAPPVSAVRADRGPRLLVLTVCCTTAVGSAAWLWAAIAAGATGRPQAFYLNLALWGALAFVVMDRRVAAVVLALATLVACAATVPRGTVSYALGCLLFGVVVGILRVSAETYVVRLGSSLGLLETFGMSAPLLTLIPSAVCGVVMGGALRRYVLARKTSDVRAGSPALAASAGAAAAAAAIALSYLTGGHLSLSALDLRIPYRVAHFPLGLPLAVAAVVAIQSLPLFGVVLGASRAILALPKDRWCAFVVGLIAVPVGGATAATTILCVPPEDPNLSAPALACFLRSGADVLYAVAALISCFAVGRLAGKVPALLARHVAG